MNRNVKSREDGRKGRRFFFSFLSCWLQLTNYFLKSSPLSPLLLVHSTNRHNTTRPSHHHHSSHTNKFLMFFSSLSQQTRYYRANSVRFETQPCEGICSLNHFCAITRIDYREYRQCLDAANAIAFATRPSMDVVSTRILLLLIALIHLYAHRPMLLVQVGLIVIHFNCSLVGGILARFNLHSKMSEKQGQTMQVKSDGASTV